MNSERAATELVEKLVKENPELNWKNVEALKRVGTIKRGTKNLRILKKKKKRRYTRGNSRNYSKKGI